MKKIFFAFLIFASIFSASAMSDFSNKNFCFGISFPTVKNDYKFDSYDSMRLNAVGLNLNYRNMNDYMKIGIFLNTDIYMPYSKVIVLDEKHQTTTNYSDYKYFFGTDILAGMYTVLYRDETFNIPVGAGFHLDGFISKQKNNDEIIKESVYTVGVGAWFNIEVNFSRNMGIYAGSKIGYDFYYKMNSKSWSSVIQDGSCNGFTIIPALGLLWHF